MSLASYESFSKDIKSSNDQRHHYSSRDSKKINIMIVLVFAIMLFLVAILSTGVGMIYTYRPAVTNMIDEILDTKTKIDESIEQLDGIVQKFNNMYVMAEMACKNFLPNCPFRMVFNITA